MRYAFVAILVALTVAPVIPAAMAQDGMDRLPESGLVIAVGGEEGSLLLQNGNDVRLLVVDSTTVIRDSHGTPLPLTGIRPGERVDYRAESWAGMSIARAIRVDGGPR